MTTFDKALLGDIPTTEAVPQPTAQDDMSVFFDKVKSGLASRESGNNYSAQSPNSSAAGKYQFINSTREMMMPGVSREQFLATPDLQEQAMNKLLQANIKDFQRQGIDTNAIPKEDLAGLLYAAHLQGSSPAARLYLKGIDSGGDANGVTASNYYNLGKKHFLEGFEGTRAPGALYAAQTGEKAKAPAPEIGWSDYLSATWKQATSETISAQRNSVAQEITNAIMAPLSFKEQSDANTALSTELDKLTLGEDLAALRGKARSSEFSFSTAPIENFRKAYESIVASNPDAVLPDFQEILDRAAVKMRNADSAYQQQTEGATLIQSMVGMIPKMAAYFTSPQEVLALAAGGLAAAALPAIGAAGSVASVAATGAVANAAGQALIESQSQPQNAEIGLGGSLSQGLANTAAAGVFGGVLGGLGAIASKAIKPILAKVFNRSTSAEAVAAVKGTDIAPIVEHTKNIVDHNAAGDGMPGLNDLNMRMQKAEMDIAAGKPVSVVPDNLGTLPHLKENADFTTAFEKIVREDLPHDADGILAVKAESIRSLNRSATMTPEDYRATPVPKEAITPELQKNMSKMVEQELEMFQPTELDVRLGNIRSGLLDEQARLRGESMAPSEAVQPRSFQSLISTVDEVKPDAVEAPINQGVKTKTEPKPIEEKIFIDDEMGIEKVDRPLTETLDNLITKHEDHNMFFTEFMSCITGK